MDYLAEGLRIEVDNDLCIFKKQNNQNIIEDEEEEEDYFETRSPINLNSKDIIATGLQITVDNVHETEKEDGEISDQNETASVNSSDSEKDMISEQFFAEEKVKFKEPRSRLYSNPFLNLDKDVKKLKTRAMRFGVSSEQEEEEPKQMETDVCLPDEKEILDLFLDCGLITDDGSEKSIDKVSQNYRVDSLLIRGTNDMSTDDIFKYFSKYLQYPQNLEWVNDACCVIIFKNLFEAAACLLQMTKKIMMVSKEAEDPSLENKDDEENDKIMDEDEIMELDYDNYESIPSNKVTVPMPPGSVWRYAQPIGKKIVLMRYATTSDKKQVMAERYSEYYKKHGNPNFKGTHGLLTKKFRKQHYRTGSSSSNSINSPVPQAKYVPPVSNKTAWTELSMKWNEEENGTASKRNKTNYKSSIAFNEKDSYNNSKKNYFKNPPSTDVLDNKPNFRIRVDFDEEDPYEQNYNQVFRNNDYYDDSVGVDLRDRLNRKRKQGTDIIPYCDEGFEPDWNKRLEGPRMKMHADDEEKRVKQRKSRTKL